MITTPKILLFRGRGLASRLIRWQTRGRYSHAALQMRDGRIVESWQTGGVRVKRLRDWRDVDAFEVPCATADQWDRAIGWCLDRVGARYDWRSVLGFVTRTQPHPNGKLFCSELVVAATRHAGFPILNAAPSLVSPDKVPWSPLLKYVPYDGREM